MTPSALDGFSTRAFRTRVLDWYDAQGRSLPFRGTDDPYRILVSEAILQQTQIARGAPAWAVFIARFPTVESLAAASPADVLRVWRGLGYNRRAINLQRAARMVVDQLGCVFPRDLAGLERLPGVGPYTARAVASIAFRQRVGAVDTNVRRVLGRAVGGEVGAFTKGELQTVADALVAPSRPDAWTHALMDLGSTICRPRAPRCPDCPVRSICRYAGRAEDGARAAPTDGSATAGSVRVPRPRFKATSRWLRGRILDRLRDADGEAWAEFAEPIGGHDLRAVAVALTALAADGLVELGPGGGRPPRARLPIA